jgi:hypothetical protein
MLHRSPHAGRGEAALQRLEVVVSPRLQSERKTPHLKFKSLKTPLRRPLDRNYFGSTTTTIGSPERRRPTRRCKSWICPFSNEASNRRARRKCRGGPSSEPFPARHGLPQIQFLEEVIALVVDDDEGGKILDLDAPDRFHAEFGIFHHLDFLDAVFGEIGRGTADRT